MKKYILLLFLFYFAKPVVAKHITGGEVIYDYTGLGSSNSKKYKITLRLFRDNFCTGCATMPGFVTLAIYDNDNNQRVGSYLNVPITNTDPLQIIFSQPCLTNAPMFDYSAGYYQFVADLPNNNNGYTVAFQTCCRVDGIANAANSQSATYMGEIPGNNTLVGDITDNSARFETGISIICANKPFTLDFSAIDPDGDNLQYDYYSAYNGGGATDASYATPVAPSYGSINYLTPYSGFNQFGTFATINTNTGFITGQAPSAGKYVVSVKVRSYRAGNYIATHRKDFIITVAPCDFASADLGNPNVKVNCYSLNTSFANLNTSPLNLTFDWEFGDPASGVLNSSTDEFPSHLFSAPGNYWVKLTVNKNTTCNSTDSLLVKVWPGFNPAFAPIPSQCKNTPVQFTDLTTTSFPPINFWKWDFGVTTLTNDTSRLQNPTYTYNAAGTYNATFIVESIKGCRDTLHPIVTIVDKPDFFISKDTLICTVDTLQLHSNVTTGNIIWSPNFMINNVTSFNPFVSPDVTTTYSATYTDQFGCVASAPVVVSVVNEVTLLAINDTTICRTDTATLNLNTDALYFNWTVSASTTIISTIKNPVVLPTASLTTYHVKASISNKCFKEKDITVKTVPYPLAIVSGDNQICFGKSAQLNASGGSSYIWSPSNYLSNANIANPVSIFPKQTITYTLTVKDTFGCPKPVTKTFTVNVIKLVADAGPADTSIVLGQPLQLTATGSTNYLWTPNTWLNTDNVFNPLANPQNNIKYTVEVSNNIGCKAIDTINVKVFFLPPDLYVPSAFSPDKNGNNDNFKPIPLGIKSLEKFSVYNRFGQLVFTTSKIGAGWDGTVKGVPQNTGTFVWQASATDYKNKKIFKKGTVILIR